MPGFNLSAVDSARSMRRLRRIAWRAQATVIPGHDPDLWPTFTHAPGYYC